MSLPTVLIVDDDRLIRTMVRDALTDVPCQVAEAADGEEALQQVQATAPRVMILDLLMPGRSGLDVLKVLKGKGHDMRIYVLTGLDSESLVRQAISDGAHGYIPKPFHPLDVQELVRAALEGQRP